MVTVKLLFGVEDFCGVRRVKGRNLLVIYDKGYDKWLEVGNWHERQVGTGIERIWIGEMIFVGSFKLKCVCR